MVVPGNSADDPLYVPIIKRIFASTAKKGLLFLGDCKMGAILTRCFVAMNGSYYVCPLSEVSHSSEAITKAKQSFSESNGLFTPVFREYENGEIKCIAEGFEETIIRSIQPELFTHLGNKFTLSFPSSTLTFLGTSVICSNPS